MNAPKEHVLRIHERSHNNWSRGVTVIRVNKTRTNISKEIASRTTSRHEPLSRTPYLSDMIDRK